MSLLSCFFIAHHIMRSVIQFFNLFIGCSYTVVGNNDSTNIIFNYNTNKDMTALLVSTTKLCMAKFAILLTLAATQILMMTGMYYISAAICSGTQDYNLILSPLFVAKEISFLFLSAIPMISFFWMLSVCIQTPIFSVGIGLASIVPSVLVINTKAWFAYPMSYPFFVITSEYGKLAANLDTNQIKLIPWIPVAIVITIICLSISCLCFGYAERK